MGCGISTLDIKDAPLNGHSNKGHQYAITQPVMENKKDFENGEEGDVVLLVEKNHNHNNYVVIMRPILGDEEVKTMKKDRSNEEMLKEKYIIEMNKEEEKALESGGKERCNGNDKYTKNVKNIEDGHEYQDGSFIGPSSPSFRDYCNEYYVSEARSSEENFNDYDFKESMKNNDDDNSSNRKNKPKNDGSVNSNKVRW
ncbi:hypothetical protein VNO77_16656 [Canavalia gladiata]|uniref:Uncharacterized protein n=1 Tax=Canavalia gladiata TaxID=3824 RepID=A0AAN9QLW9_CANGL